MEQKNAQSTTKLSTEESSVFRSILETILDESVFALPHKRCLVIEEDKIYGMAIYIDTDDECCVRRWSFNKGSFLKLYGIIQGALLVEENLSNCSVNFVFFELDNDEISSIVYSGLLVGKINEMEGSCFSSEGYDTMRVEHTLIAFSENSKNIPNIEWDI